MDRFNKETSNKQPNWFYRMPISLFSEKLLDVGTGMVDCMFTCINVGLSIYPPPVLIAVLPLPGIFASKFVFIVS